MSVFTLSIIIHWYVLFINESLLVQMCKNNKAYSTGEMAALLKIVSVYPEYLDVPIQRHMMGNS